jgi:hypothetical protein
MSSVAKLAASFLTQYLAGRGVRKLVEVFVVVTNYIVLILIAATYRLVDERKYNAVLYAFSSAKYKLICIFNKNLKVYELREIANNTFEKYA